MRILKELPSLSSTELYIYKYIMNHPAEVAKMTIGDLAAKTNTSTASILRLCRKYGCQGYSEFKYKLRNELGDMHVNKNLSSDSHLNDLIYFFETTARSQSFVQSIDEAAQILADNSLIIFAGMGGSNIMCEYGVLYFSYLFNLAFRIEDMFNISLDFFPRDLSEKTCIIVLSSSGDTSDIFPYIKNYHTRGCKLITITSNADSLLGRMADTTISYNLPLTIEGENNLTSQAPVAYIIEQLSRRVVEIRSEKNIPLPDESKIKII